MVEEPLKNWFAQLGWANFPENSHLAAYKFRFYQIFWINLSIHNLRCKRFSEALQPALLTSWRALACQASQVTECYRDQIAVHASMAAPNPYFGTHWQEMRIKQLPKSRESMRPDTNPRCRTCRLRRSVAPLGRGGVSWIRCKSCRCIRRPPRGRTVADLPADRPE